MDGSFAPIGRRPRAISMFSGMEAASVAAHPLGWEFAAFAEIEPAACWTLAHHYGCGGPIHMPRPEEAKDRKGQMERLTRIKAVSGIPERTDPRAPVNVGDMTQVDWESYRGRIDVVVGGPPCQAFSVAGMRRSLEDDRGNLSLQYVRAIHAIRPLWSFTENVPGWLSTKDNAFGCYLGALVGADAALEPPSGGRWGSAGVVDGPLFRAAWRILDAQGFVPQRRRRVFVVAARAGTGGDPVRVLFETEAEAERNLGERARGGPLFPVREGGRRDPAAGGEARQGAPGPAAAGVEGRGREGLSEPLAFGGNNCSGPIEVSTALNAHGGPNGRQDFESETFVCQPADAPGEEDALLRGEPQGYRVHAAFSTAMTSNGTARVADPVDCTRSLDTTGGFATNQGGNIVVQPTGVPEDPEKWIPETSVTIRARDAKGSPDSDCTWTLLPVPDEGSVAPDGTISFQCQGTNVGAETEMVGTVRRGNQHVTGGVPMVAERAAADAPGAVRVDEDEAVFLHCNKGRPDGRKSAHVEMVSVKPIVETLTTDGHSQSAVAVPTGEPIAFSSKDYGGDAGPLAPTLRAGPHVDSHANSGVHVAVVISHEIREAPEQEVRLFQDSEFGVAEYHEAGTLRAGRIPEHQMLLTPATADSTAGPGAPDDAGLEAYATETGQGFWSEREPGLRVSAAPTQPQTIIKQIGMLVRRLTPTECLSLQGFPRDYLDGVLVRGKPLADGPRYKMAGNSWCAPLIRWVFTRLDEHMAEQLVEARRD